MTDISPIPPPTGETPTRHPSLPALRAAHGELVQRRRATGDTPELLADVRAFIGRGEATGVLLDAEDDRLAAQSLLDFWANTLVRAGEQPPDATLADFDPMLAPELPDTPCPYRGLAAFGEDDREFFFGREELLDKMIGRLRDGDRLLAVVGSSGSGKSSVVLAGLLPRLKGGALPGSEGWRYATIVPGSQPLTSLAHAIPPAGEAAAGLDVVAAARLLFAAEGFRRDPDLLVSLLDETAAAPLVLVVDQFEELFTLCTDGEARTAFVRQLLGLVAAAGSQHRVILTMRTDFVDNVAGLPDLFPLFRDARVDVEALDINELRAAIEGPAARVGLKFEEGISDDLISTILGERAGLPLLQFTLLKLWEERQRNRVTREVYQEVGNPREALERSAEAFYKSLIPEEQETAKRILLRMVRPGEGREVTSNRIRRAEVFRGGEATDRVERVLNRLIGEARLVKLTAGETPADAQVEVAHEALVRNWPRLVGWLEDEREVLRRRRRLTDAAEQWERTGRDASALLRGALLEEALRYGDLNELETAFVQASQAELEATEREREAARQRELAQARALAEEQRRRADEQARAARQLRRLLIALGVVFIAALGAAGFALVKQQQAVNAQATAQAEALARTASDYRAAARAIEATAANATAVAEATARSTAEIQARQAEATTIQYRSEIQDTAATRAAEIVRQIGLPTPSPTRPTRVPLTPTPTVTEQPLPVRTGTATPLSPTRGPTATATPTATWTRNPATATALANLQAQLLQVQGTQTAVVALLPGRGMGKIAYSSNQDGNYEIYTVKADGTGQTRITNDLGDDWSPAWSPDGRRIAFTSTRGSRDPGVHNIFVMDADGKTPPRQLTFNYAWDENARWSPDETRIAFVSTADGNAEIFTINADGGRPQRLTTNRADDWTPDWSPDGKRLIFSSLRTGSWQVFAMDVDGNNQTRITFDGANDLQPVWSPDGRRITFFSDRDGNPEIYMMNADGSGQTRLTNNPASDKNPIWSPDGSALVFWSDRQRGVGELYVMWANGSYQVRLVEGQIIDGSPSWGR
ncbi:MAG: hypothetical protein NT169_15265 [Chloroflexi bacterium]|nr:hypothetical protein [Chloroflexota bacterium]